MTSAIPRPDASEYAPNYETYVSKVPDGNLLTILEDQRQETQALLAGIPEGRALHRYAPGKWSIKEVVGHVTDAERVFCYRALRFARDPVTPLPGFDEKTYTPAGRFDDRSLPDIAAEPDAVRGATIALFRGLMSKRSRGGAWRITKRSRCGLWPTSSPATNGTTWRSCGSATSSS